MGIHEQTLRRQHQVAAMAVKALKTGSDPQNTNWKNLEPTVARHIQVFQSRELAQPLLKCNTLMTMQRDVPDDDAFYNIYNIYYESNINRTKMAATLRIRVTCVLRESIVKYIEHLWLWKFAAV